MTEQTQNPPVVAVDRFPVNVVTSDLSLREVKVVMTKPVDGVGRLIVWSAPNVVALETDFLLDESDIRSKQVDWTVQTSGGVVVIQPSPGCGCGNRLKLFTPFTPMKMGRLR